jgi:predicted kinase
MSRPKNWTEAASVSRGELLAWAEGQPWAHAMRACAQDAEWHAEGDVWTHTRMVWDEVERLDDFAAFTPAQRRALDLTALWHDAGKPATTAPDPETGRLRSPKHALVGARLARTVLRDWGCDLPTREGIVNLVRYHGRPPYLLEQAKPEAEVIRLSWLLDHRLLHAFALADTRGRKTRDTARAEELIHCWRDTAREQGCWGVPYPFSNEQARFLYFRDPTRNLHWTPYEDHAGTVVLMSGIPAAGKDTWLRNHRPDLPVVSLDDVRADLDVDPEDDQGRVAQEARERCRQHLRAGESFAFNATNLQKQTRSRWIDLFADYRFRVEIVYLEPLLETALRRNRRRERPVPERIIRRNLDRAEIPTPGEAHSVRWFGPETDS